MLKSLIRRDFVARGLTAVAAVTPIVAAASFRDIQCVGIGAAVAPGAPSAVVGRCAVSILVFFAHKGIRSRSHNQILGFKCQKFKYLLDSFYSFHWLNWLHEPKTIEQIKPIKPIKQTVRLTPEH